jgi:hypothetical protein
MIELIWSSRVRGVAVASDLLVGDACQQKDAAISTAAFASAKWSDRPARPPPPPAKKTHRISMTCMSDPSDVRRVRTPRTPRLRMALCAMPVH